MKNVITEAQVKSGESLKLLIFSVGKLNVSLPIESVQKVINYTPIYSSGLNHLGIAHVGDREVTVIDLHKQLFAQDTPKRAEEKCYLILATNSRGEQFGILVEKTPALSDVAFTNIRTIPESYRHADTLRIATHVTIIPQEKEQLTVFILDVDQLLAPISTKKTKVFKL